MTETLAQQLDRCQIVDRYRLGRQLRELQNRAADTPDYRRRHAQILERIRESQKACERRDLAIPAHIQFPEQLPVSGKAGDIAEVLRDNRVVVVAGDTGSGKTTQLPKICLQAGLGRRGLIGHTQPRRLAAVSVATRIAEELQTELGQGVGYQVRFNEKLSPDSYLKVMTDGILLAEIAQDRFLNRYEVLIIDEAHERSLNIDFLLGFLNCLIQKRADLKLIITSATIDVEKFSAHFDGAPIIKVSGRTYPVETRYAPPEENDEDAGIDPQISGVCDAVQQIVQDRNQPQGDILAFFSGEREIREAAQALRKRRLPGLEILPLYARLRQSEQTRIFQPHSGRRVVLATNVAETSITVPGINFVIDTGTARISRYSIQSKVQRLPIEPISQASANQRKGRCGRLAGGICIRLYSEEDFDSRPLYTDPEIKRTNLASVILRMKHLRLGEVVDFPFLEPPESKAVNEGSKLLLELNALSVAGDLTEAGRRMALLPVDPRYARMLITAAEEDCLHELLIIVSGLSIPDPREMNQDNRSQANQKLEHLQHQDSDFLTLVNLWEEFEQRRQSLSQNQLRKYCKTHFLSYLRMREWRELHRQLMLATQQLGMRCNRTPAGYAQVHRSIISGSLNQIALHQEGREYLNNRNRRFRLSPGSVLSDKRCRWLVTGELIETRQTFASLAAKIQPEWVEQMALHLVRREHFQPHWSARKQRVMAHEKVQLYGLTLIENALIENALIDYAKIDPPAAREIFIRDALVGGAINTRAAFYSDNRSLLEALAREEEKIRRPDHFVTERDVFRFYDTRLPADLCHTRGLEGWLREGGQEAQRRLTMDRDALLGEAADKSQSEAYPDQASLRDNRFRIDYVFDPGHIRDGATIEVPIAVLAQLTQGDIDWAVPGLIRERCITLLKSLPKSLRKNFIPVSGFVDSILPNMAPGDGDLLTSLLAQINRSGRAKLSRSDFDSVELPHYLQAKIRLVNANGEEIAFGHEVKALQQDHLKETDAANGDSGRQCYGHELEQSGLTDWTFGELPEEVRLGGDLILVRYPAIVDEQDSVAVRLLADQVSARQQTSNGLLRLAMLGSVQSRNRIRKQFKQLANKNALILPGNQPELVEDAVVATYRSAFDLGSLPRTREQFTAWLSAGKREVHGQAQAIEQLLLEILQVRWELVRSLAALPDALGYLREDIQGQLDSLLAEGFVRSTSFRWLAEFPRFLRASLLRLAKSPHMGPNDRTLTEELAAARARLSKLADRIAVESVAELEDLSWMIEEYRVSLFAQKLGTSIPVSAKRLDKQFSKLDK